MPSIIERGVGCSPVLDMAIAENNLGIVHFGTRFEPKNRVVCVAGMPRSGRRSMSMTVTMLVARTGEEEEGSQPTQCQGHHGNDGLQSPRGQRLHSFEGEGEGR
jgi:hypothetical protein